MNALGLPVGDARAKALAGGLLLLVLAALLFGAVLPLVQFYGERAAALGHQRAVAERMARLVAELPALEAQVAKLPAPPAASAAALSFAGLATKLQQFANEAHVTLVSTEPVPGKPVSGRGEKASVQVTGAYADLIGLLGRLSGATPEIVIETLELHANGGPDQALALHLVVYAVSDAEAAR